MSEQELLDERRRNDTLVLKLIEEINSTVKRFEHKLDEHIADEMKEFHTLRVEAFPSGDVAEHRKAHEAWMREMEERHVLRQKLITSVVEKGVWGLLVALIGVTWYWLKGHL